VLGIGIAPVVDRRFTARVGDDRDRVVATIGDPELALATRPEGQGGGLVETAARVNGFDR
jgi:hypothetical protein